MTPQDSFMYAAPIRPECEAELRAVLASMNRSPGVVDPLNPILPFQRLTNLHFARVLIVKDLAAADRAVYGMPVSGLPDYLVLLGEIDGEERAFRRALVASAEEGLRRLFSYCVGFSRDTELTGWLGQSSVRPAAAYVNWVGRTVRQVQEEEQLRCRLEAYLNENLPQLRSRPLRDQHANLRSFALEEQRRGALTLTRPARTPLRWRLRNALHLLSVPVALLVASPLLLLYLPVFVMQLRRWEKTDPAVAPRLEPGHAAELSAIENHDVTNQFNVFGSLKPGRQRRWSMRFFLWIVNYTARHIYNRGGLARVSTIHFARWVPFDGGERMLFSSMYDGSLESYMDDFINKVGFGLNITFSNGIGYPRTRWLVLDGCRDEQVFKRVLRRHQLPTEVWYSAHPGLTAANKHRNSLIRAGIEKASMTDAEVRDWLALF
jgi:hypothetical protein